MVAVGPSDRSLDPSKGALSFVVSRLSFQHPEELWSCTLGCAVLKMEN